MSKKALEDLISKIEKGLTEEFRKEIDYNNLCFEYSIDNIVREIKDELELIKQFLPDSIIQNIAKNTVKNLDEAFRNSASRVLQKDKNEREKEIKVGKIFLSNERGSNTFRILSDILRPVRYSMIKEVEEAGIKIQPVNITYKSNNPKTPDTIVQSKEFFNIEHLTTVSDLRIASEFTRAAGTKRKAINLINKIKVFASPTAKDILDEYILTIVSKTNAKGTVIKDLTLSLEWKSEKRNKEAGREEISARKRFLAQELRNIISTQIIKGKTLEASDSVEEVVAKKYFSMVDAAIKQTGRVRKKFQPNKISNKSTKASKSFEIKSKVASKKTANLGPSGIQITEKKTETPTTSMEGPSALQVIAYINARLQQTIEKNMIPPALESRTGRFSGSVKVLNMIRTRQGLPSFEYTYDKNPYQVFEMGIGRSPWATPQRDPRKLIDKSIREIATEMLQGRLYTRRV